jgi:outer membrane receptor protein involved in Fe transport
MKSPNHHRHRRILARLLMSTCLPLALAWPAAASAQDQAEGQTAQDQQQGAAAPAPQSSSQAQGASKYAGIESVTITARKKEEREIDVPIAAVAMPAETIQRYATTDLTQLSVQAPGVRINRASGGTPGSFIYIRGIGTFGSDYASEQPVSVVIDGVPISRGHIVDSGFFDMASIQVLKGPQSLYFGKNTPAGVIAIDSVSPGDELEGYIRGSYGIAQEDPTLEGAISVPISDKFKIRIALRGEDMQGGYMKNDALPTTLAPGAFPDPILANGTTLPGRGYKEYPQTKQLIGRFTAVFTPNDKFDATLKVFGSYYHNNSSAGANAIIHCDNDGPSYVSGGVAYVDDGYQCGYRRHNNDAQVPEEILAGFIRAPEDGQYFTEGKNYLTSLKMNYDFGAFTVTSLTGLYLLRSSEFGNYDATVFAETPDYQLERTRDFTQEVHAVSNFDGPVNVTFGAFYEDEHRTLYNTNRIVLLAPYPDPTSPYYGATNTMIDYDVNNAWSFSAFGELNWKITDNLELAGGGRWTKVNKDTHVTQPFEYLTILGAANPFAPTGADYEVRVKEDNFSPQATLTWHPVENTTLYAAYRTGFLSGGVGNPGVVTNYTGFTQDQLHNALAFDAEKAKGFEVGFKGQFFDGILSGDITAFRYRYNGLQVATFHPETTSFSIGNAASAIDQGIEVNAAIQATDALSFHVGVEYVDLHYKSYPNAPCNATQIAGVGDCFAAGMPNPDDPAHPLPAHQDLSGEAFGDAPLTINIGAVYDVPISDTWNLGVTADVTAANKGKPLNRQAYTAMQAYTLLNASLRLYQPDGDWEFAVIGTNLTNTIYATTLGGKPLGTANDIWGVVNPGREVRLQVTRKF